MLLRAKRLFPKKNNKILHVPAVLNTAIDSTGAGDIFLSMFFALNLSKNFTDYEKLIAYIFLPVFMLIRLEIDFVLMFWIFIK